MTILVWETSTRKILRTFLIASATHKVTMGTDSQRVDTHMLCQSYHTAVVLAADRVDVATQPFMRNMLYDGDGGPADMTEARLQFKKEADKGHTRFGGVCGQVDMVRVRVQLKKAAPLGHMEAQYNLATMLRHGVGGPVDMTEARVRFNQATDQGHVSAQICLAQMLYDGMVSSPQRNTLAFSLCSNSHLPTLRWRTCYARVAVS